MIFWNWIQAADGQDARLILSGVIDSGESWYDDAVTPARFERELSEHDGEAIVVEINSPGGDVFAGWEIYNKLLHRRGKTAVLITGVAASAASIVAMAADAGELAICEVGMLMVHNPWTYAMGNAEALRDQADVLDAIRDVMLSSYMHRFHGTEAEMMALLNAESYLTPAKALELGLVDRIDTREAENAQAPAAALPRRYAAMDMSARLAQRAVKRHGRKDETPQGARDYLAEADAIVCAATRANGFAPANFE